MRIPKLTYSNVAATLALFLALGGGAYALTLGKNSVKRKNIAPGAVSTKKLAKDAVTGAKAKESSFGTVPNAAKLGGIPPAGFVGAENAIQRVHNEAVPVGSDGVVFTISGVGSVQFQDCSNPTPSIPVGKVHYANTSSQDEDIWSTATAADGVPPSQVQFFTQQANPVVLVQPNVPNQDLSYRLDLQIASRGTPSKLTLATLSATYDFNANPDVCRYSLWTSKTEESPG